MVLNNHQPFNNRERFTGVSSSSMAFVFNAVFVLYSTIIITVPTSTNAWMIQPSSLSSFVTPKMSSDKQHQIVFNSHHRYQPSKHLQRLSLQQRVTNTEESTKDTILQNNSHSKEEVVAPVYDYEIPEDAVIHIKPSAMRRLRELRDQRQRDVSSNSDDGNNDDHDDDDYLILRMGVRSGGCSGMSYVMDFCTKDSIDLEEDQMDVYQQDKIKCVVDSKSMLYLYGLQLDYSTQLIGGGFKFYNPNAEESCGCGSSFGV